VFEFIGTPDALSADKPTMLRHKRELEALTSDREKIMYHNQNKNTHTRTHLFNGPLSGLPSRAGTRKVKPIWILLKQETVSGSGISWAICKSAPHSRQITTPPLRFLQAGCPACRPSNSVKALKAITLKAVALKATSKQE